MFDRRRYLEIGQSVSDIWSGSDTHWAGFSGPPPWCVIPPTSFRPGISGNPGRLSLDFYWFRNAIQWQVDISTAYILDMMEK